MYIIWRIKNSIYFFIFYFFLYFFLFYFYFYLYFYLFIYLYISEKNRIRRIQYDPEEDDMYGIDFAYSDDEDTEQSGACTTNEISRPGVVVDF